MPAPINERLVVWSIRAYCHDPASTAAAERMLRALRRCERARDLAIALLTESPVEHPVLGEARAGQRRRASRRDHLASRVDSATGVRKRHPPLGDRTVRHVAVAGEPCPAGELSRPVRGTDAAAHASADMLACRARDPLGTAEDSVRERAPIGSRSTANRRRPLADVELVGAERGECGRAPTRAPARPRPRAATRATADAATSATARALSTATRAADIAPPRTAADDGPTASRDQRENKSETREGKGAHGSSVTKGEAPSLCGFRTDPKRRDPGPRHVQACHLVPRPGRPSHVGAGGPCSLPASYWSKLVEPDHERRILAMEQRAG